ncbi:MAG: hypothetical protein QNL54_07865 [Rhodobacterales bacterium]
MKDISLSVYRNLTSAQRVVASIEALARGDEEEKRRLVKSCPRKSYTQNDAQYTRTMENLLDLAIAVEADLREYVIYFLIAIRADPTNAVEFLQRYSDLRAGWNSAISRMGIDPESMRKAGPPPCPVFEMIEDLVPPPNSEVVEKLAAEMEVIFCRT